MTFCVWLVSLSKMFSWFICVVCSMSVLGFPMVQTVKNLPAVQETRVQSLGWEDPLEKEMATHSIAWKISWTEEPGGLQSMGS